MYEKSRDLSYDNPSQQAFYDRISGLAKSFDNNSTRIIIIGNDASFWEMIDQKSREELFHIITELFVNMKKHSRASQVVLRFININNEQEIKYIDNGIGISKDVTEKNGFSNMRSRLKAINSRLEVQESNAGVQLSIKL